MFVRAVILSSVHFLWITRSSEYSPVIIAYTSATDAKDARLKRPIWVQAVEQIDWVDAYYRRDIGSLAT